jgi:hypothetical protein
MTPLSRSLFLLLWFIIAVILIPGCNRNRTNTIKETEIRNYSELMSLFADPTAEFRPAPFWVWHEIITDEQISHSLRELKEKGFGGVFVHPRYGMVTEYLSDEWFDRFEHTLKEADRMGMYVWIYDENSYPSGFAGGLVPDVMPDSYRHGGALRLHKTNTFNPDPDLRYLHFFEKKPDGEMVEITDPAEKSGASGDFSFFEIVDFPQTKWYAGHSYVDLLYPGVTEKFMEVTMEGYEARFGKHFGGLIRGIFTDEPNISPPGGRNTIKWTPGLYDEFERKWGYRLQDHLLSLFEETGDWKRVRHNHFQLLLQMFIDYWAKPWYDYTEKQGLIWTGHYWEHGWPSPHHGGDNMAMYAWHQMPGIDLLFNTIYSEDRTDQFGRIMNVKELRSVANQTGRNRTLSETYGGAGWELTFEDMKRLGDWSYVLGVNFLNQHMTYMTMLGDRKHDYPQSFSYHTPWWDMYNYQNEYFARLSVAMSAGKQVNNVLVIEPTSSTWMYYSSYHPNRYINEIGNSFHELLDGLEQHKIAYDLGSENIIKDTGRARNGKFIVGKAEYEVVVLPYGMENIDGPTFALLESFLESGGTAVSLNAVPGRIDGKESLQPARLMEKYKDKWLLASHFTDKPVYEVIRNKKIRFSESAMKSKWFLHHKRELEDGRLVFLVNSEPQESVEGNFTVRGKKVVRLDPQTGTATAYPFVAVEENVNLSFTIEPAGSLLFFISDNEIATAGAPARPVANKVLETGQSRVKPLSPNMMVLDFGELSIENNQAENLYYYTAGDRVWKHYGYNDNPWSMSVQFKTDLVDGAGFPDASGFEFTYRFTAEEGTDLLSVNAVAERPRVFRMKVNGVTVDPVDGRWFIDREFAVYSIGEFLKYGENNISLNVAPMDILAELQPVYLTGFFSLKNSEKGWKMTRTEQLPVGSWKRSGYPFYSDRVSYSRTATLSGIPETVIVRLNEWKGTVAEIVVNGRSVGIIQQQPYEAEITDHLVSGVNDIEVVVYGSLKNLMGPHHNITRRGIVTPTDFRRAPSVQPPGEEYDLLDYGLMEDFDILISAE